MNEAEIKAVKPITTPEHLSEVYKGDFYSKCVFVLSIVLGLTALSFSAVAFMGFAENDTGLTHLLSAFALSFGLGALAFLPLSIIAYYAKRAIANPLPSYRAILVLLLILPWFFLCYYLMKIEGVMRYSAIICLLSALFIGAWALRFLRTR